METRLRMLLVLAGLPGPTVNHIIRADDGSWRHRLDLSFPDLRLAIEYDGRQHAESSAQWVRDVARREELDGAGWRLVVVLSGDLYRHPRRTLERVVAAVRERGRPVTIRQSEWMRYLPERRTA